MINQLQSSFILGNWNTRTILELISFSSSIADSTVEHQETSEHEGHSFSFSSSSKFRLNKDRPSSQTKDCVIS